MRSFVDEQVPLRALRGVQVPLITCSRLSVYVLEVIVSAIAPNCGTTTPFAYNVILFVFM